MMASLINDSLFGKYSHTDYHFSLIHFNHNPRLQNILIHIIEENSNHFNTEQGIETSCVIIPELPYQILQPVIMKQHLSYKGFKNGTLNLICSENYACSIYWDKSHERKLLHDKSREHIERGAINYKEAFLLLKKGDIISNTRLSKIFYLNAKLGYLWGYHAGNK